jgi:hypothetical protein
LSTSIDGKDPQAKMATPTMRRTVNPDQTPTSDPAAYEPPQVTDLGDFADLTRGNVFAGTSDDGTGAGRFYT